MLPAAHRMRRPDQFERAVRQGVRAGRSTLVVHLVTRTDPGPGPAVGFVVSKAVGGAVQRNAVRRRLRSAMRTHLSDVPPTVDVVVRALPGSAAQDFATLDRDLRGAMSSALARRERTGRTS